MVEWNGIFRLFRFSGILGQPREVHPKFRNEIPENDCSIRPQTRNFRNFWSNGKRPLSRHHCPRDPMRLPSACATSVPFRARYQFSRGFSLRGEKRLYLEVSWRFFVLKASKLTRESIKSHVFVRRTRHGGISQCNNPARKR